jgi:hypothetical protein
MELLPTMHVHSAIGLQLLALPSTLILCFTSMLRERSIGERDEKRLVRLYKQHAFILELVQLFVTLMAFGFATGNTVAAFEARALVVDYASEEVTRMIVKSALVRNAWLFGSAVCILACVNMLDSWSLPESIEDLTDPLFRLTRTLIGACKYINLIFPDDSLIYNTQMSDRAAQSMKVRSSSAPTTSLPKISSGPLIRRNPPLLTAWRTFQPRNAQASPQTQTKRSHNLKSPQNPAWTTRHVPPPGTLPNQSQHVLWTLSRGCTQAREIHRPYLHHPKKPNRTTKTKQWPPPSAPSPHPHPSPPSALPPHSPPYPLSPRPHPTALPPTPPKHPNRHHKNPPLPETALYRETHLTNPSSPRQRQARS